MQQLRITNVVNTDYSRRMSQYSLVISHLNWMHVSATLHVWRLSIAILVEGKYGPTCTLAVYSDPIQTGTVRAGTGSLAILCDASCNELFIPSVEKYSSVIDDVIVDIR